MKATKGNIHRFVKLQLATKPEWALKALVRIFKENQTPSEQSSQTTVEDNGIGFTGTDANFLSSLADQYIRRGRLSDKQMVYVMKRMQKYHRQVVLMSDQANLLKMVLAAPTPVVIK